MRPSGDAGIPNSPVSDFRPASQTAYLSCTETTVVSSVRADSNVLGITDW